MPVAAFAGDEFVGGLREPLGGRGALGVDRRRDCEAGENEGGKEEALHGGYYQTSV